MTDKQIKVTDKRMFTADGELREEYKNLGKAATGRGGQAEAKADEGAESGAKEGPPEDSPDLATEPPASAGPPTAGQIPTATPTFLDLVGLLAEPVTVYLGDVRLPDGSSAENLELARLHIDLLEVLQETTRGNLDARESSFLDDLLYRLRLRYVQKKG